MVWWRTKMTTRESLAWLALSALFAMAGCAVAFRVVEWGR